MTTILDWFREWDFSAKGGRPTDYYATLVGVAFAGIFCFFLASLVFQTRKRSAVDVMLSAVLTVFGLVCLTALYRLTHTVWYVSYLTPTLWALATLFEVLASVFLISERRGYPVQLPRFRRRKRT